MIVACAGPAWWTWLLAAAWVVLIAATAGINGGARRTLTKAKALLAEVEEFHRQADGD